MESHSSNAKRGAKRKRSQRKQHNHDDDDDDLETKITGKLHHELREIRKASKKVKSFETQKLVKKLKRLRHKNPNDKEIKESEVELEILKREPHEPIANTALKTRLNKDGNLSSNITILAALSTEFTTTATSTNDDPSPPMLMVHATPGTPQAKVQNRLMSAKRIARAVTHAVEELRRLVQSSASASRKRSAKRAKLIQDVLEDGHGRESGHDGGSENDSDNGSDSDSDGRTKDAETDSEGEWHGVGEGNLGRDEGDAGWESGTVDEDNDYSRGGRSSRNETDGDDSKAADDISVEGSAVHVKKPRPPAVSTTKSGASTSRLGAQSTFLPSLAVGFVRGDSDGSEWSDDEARMADGEARKNRRGQRARRAIWEKKYGNNANHKKKEREATRFSGRGGPFNSFTASRWTNIPVSDRRGQHHYVHNIAPNPGQGQGVDGKVSIKANAPSRKGEMSLHPSWEAKKRMKERERVGIVPAEGTKIKF